MALWPVMVMGEEWDIFGEDICGGGDICDGSWWKKMDIWDFGK